MSVDFSKKLALNELPEPGLEDNEAAPILMGADSNRGGGQAAANKKNRKKNNNNKK